MSAKPPVRRALLQIHFCVVLWGFTAILGKLISLPALPLVWWRMLLVVVAIALWPPVWRALRATDRRTLLLFSGAGVIVALHWLTFYGAIKLSNASVAASCMAIAPIFMAVVEPWIARRSFDPREVVIGVVALPGVALVVGGTPGAMRTGIVVGALSALLVVIFGSLNKRLIERAAPLLMTWVELAAGTVFLGIVAAFMPGQGQVFVLPDGRDFALLATLCHRLHAAALHAVAARAPAHQRLHRAARHQPRARLRGAACDRAAGRAARAVGVVLLRALP